MPHIRAVFVDTTPGVRDFLKIYKTKIREIFAEKMGYPSEDVAFYPHRISKEDAELADNLLPLEFVMDTGTHLLDVEGLHAAMVEQAILNQCDGAQDINFGIWIIAHAKNAFTEHRPN